MTRGPFRGNPQWPWVSANFIYYPAPLSMTLAGVKFRVQILAYDATKPGRRVFSTNYVVEKILLP